MPVTTNWKEPHLDTESIIANLEAERDRLDQAIAALKGRKSKTSNGRRGRHLSAAAKKRISDAQKKRWAAQKRGAA
jgi:exonuclease VII small subunit